MADLDNLQSSQSVKIAGADSSGSETTFVDATANGDLQTADLINVGTGVQSSLTIGTTAVEVKVGVSRLSNRKLVTLYNNSNVTVYWGYSGSVTTSSGTPIFKNQFISWTVGDQQSIYVVAGSENNDSRITEAA